MSVEMNKEPQLLAPRKLSKRQSIAANAGMGALVLVGGGLLWIAIDQKEDAWQKSQKCDDNITYHMLTTNPGNELDVTLGTERHVNDSKSYDPYLITIDQTPAGYEIDTPLESYRLELQPGYQDGSANPDAMFTSAYNERWAINILHNNDGSTDVNVAGTCPVG